MDIRIHKKIFSKIKIKSRIDPNRISFISVIISIIAAYYLYKNFFIIGAFLIFLVIILDFLDGAVARGNEKRNMDPIADWTSDRLSEAIIFIPFGPLGIFLVALNTALTICFSKNKLFILPLRHLLFLWLIITFIYLPL